MSLLDKIRKDPEIMNLIKEAEQWWASPVEHHTVAECERLLEIYAELIRRGDPKTKADKVFYRPRARLQLIMARLQRPGEGGVLFFIGHSKVDRALIESELALGLAEIEKMLEARKQPLLLTTTKKEDPLIYHLINDYLIHDSFRFQLEEWEKTYRDFQKRLSE